MEATFACPVCGGCRWREFHRYHYRPDAPGLTPYEAVRQRVLFEVWFPGADTVSLAAVVCEECGLVSCQPRPTAADVDGKYAFLGRFPIPAAPMSSVGTVADGRRAQRIAELVTSSHGPGRLKVLDFGGGDGKLLGPLIEAGHEGLVVDYEPNTIPGATRIGSTLDDVDPQTRFDAIVCSHVLEHLASPLDVLRSLAGMLAPGGVMYGEVPVEVWRGIPVRRDPVTHVNFFTLPTFVELFRRAGLTVVHAEELAGAYGELTMDVAVVVAGASAPASKPAIAKGRPAQQLINPGPAEHAKWMWRRRRHLARGARRRLLKR